jgi:hypothetical protein
MLCLLITVLQSNLIFETLDLGNFKTQSKKRVVTYIEHLFSRFLTPLLEQD